MRVLLSLTAVMMLFGCATEEQAVEEHQAQVNVDVAQIPAFLGALDAMTESDIGVEKLVDLTNSVPMDQERQERFAVMFKGEETELLYHVWVEQEGWVHLYLSSPSKGLIDAINTTKTGYARADDS